MGRFGDLNLSDLSQDLIKQISIDFITTDLSPSEIQRKYNLTEKAYYNIRDRLNLIKKRTNFQKKVLDKALHKLSTRQSQLILKAFKILDKHVDRIGDIQQRVHDRDLDDPQAPLGKILDNDTVRDVMKILEMMQKEKRLDEDKPTDNIGISVKVELDSSIPVIGRTIIEPEDAVIVSETPAAEVTQQKVEEKKEDVKVEVEGLGGLI